jgi:hypothetical protein
MLGAFSGIGLYVVVSTNIPGFNFFASSKDNIPPSSKPTLPPVANSSGSS